MSRGVGLIQVNDDPSGSYRRWRVFADVLAERTAELAAGQVIRVRVAKEVSGLTPPPEANSLSVAVKDGAGSTIRTFTLDPALNEQTFDVAWTSDVLATGIASAGSYELDIRAALTSGIGAYSVSSDSRGTQTLSAGQSATRDRFWQRATTTAHMRIGRGAGAVAAPLLGYGDDVRVRAEFGHRVINPSNSTIFSWRRADTNAELAPAQFAQHGTGNAFIEATLLSPVNNVLPKLRLLTGLIIQWANFPASGQQFLSPTWTNDPYPEVDPRLWYEHKLQVSPNKSYGTPPSTTFNAARRLTTEIGYLSERPKNVRGEGMNGITWTTKLWDVNEETGTEAAPVLSRSVTSGTVNGETGWPATLLAWTAQLPAGGWNKKVTITGPFGATGLELDSLSQHSLVAVDPQLVCTPAPGPQGTSSGSHVTPGEPLIVSMSVFHVGRSEVVAADVGTPKALVARLNQALGHPETLQLDGTTWLSSLVPANNVYHELVETFADSRTYTKILPGTSTVGWSDAHVLMIGKATINGSPVANYIKEPVVAGFSRHNVEDAMSPEDIAAIVNGVWDESTAEARALGSYGATVATNLDAKVSTRSTPADVPPADPRMANLDAAVSTRLPTADLRLDSLANLDATVSSRASSVALAAVDTFVRTLATAVSVDSLLTRLTAARAALIDNLDALVSSRATKADVNVQVYSTPVPEGKVH